MVVLNSDNSKFTATLQGDAAGGGVDAILYGLSRSMLRIKRQDSQTMSLVRLYDVSVGFDCTYYTDPDGVLEIPLKNVVNLAIGSGIYTLQLRVTMFDLDGTTVDTLWPNIDVVPGMSYYDINAPRNKDCGQLFSAYSNRFVMPPNVILNPVQLSGLTAYGVEVESNFSDTPGTVTWEQCVNGVYSVIGASGLRSNRLKVSNTATSLRVTHVNGGVTNIKEWKLEKADYCSDIACIQWTSMTGCRRTHYFPIVSHLRGEDKAVSLVTPGDGYDVKKNATFGVRCRLTGLTAYSFWYYLDLMQASDVHAIILQTTGNFGNEMSSAQTAAYVTDGPTETPSGTGFFNFDFTLKLRHYDTL